MHQCVCVTDHQGEEHHQQLQCDTCRYQDVKSVSMAVRIKAEEKTQHRNKDTIILCISLLSPSGSVGFGMHVEVHSNALQKSLNNKTSSAPETCLTYVGRMSRHFRAVITDHMLPPVLRDVLKKFPGTADNFTRVQTHWDFTDQTKTN